MDHDRQDPRHDIVARMALVPRTLEARGLDATPLIQAKLRKAGDLRAVEILDVILHDEIGHVAIGNHWYGWLCEREGLDPVVPLYDRLMQNNTRAPRLPPPAPEPGRPAARLASPRPNWIWLHAGALMASDAGSRRELLHLHRGSHGTPARFRNARYRRRSQKLWHAAHGRRLPSWRCPPTLRDNPSLVQSMHGSVHAPGATPPSGTSAHP